MSNKGNWLKVDDELVFMDGDAISTVGKKIPINFYKTAFHPLRGTFLKETEIKLSHGKIYGHSQEIADHISKAFELNPEDKNLGVLLSGERGLGKTLTTRLVIEQLKDKYPVISISEYTSDLPVLLSHIKNSIILMDEFEKFMGGNICGSENEDDQTKQEALLSILDGNTGCSGNLFLLTVNNVYKVDDNLISRPGRIRYHYRYVSEDADTVRKYCQDNLERKDLTEEVVKVLSITKCVSLDIITQFVDELNKFPELKPLEALKIFNIESTSKNYNIIINVECKDTRVQYSRSFRNYLSCDWAQLSPKYRNMPNDVVPQHISISLNEEDIPPYIYGKEQLDVDSIIVEDAEIFDISDIKILSAFIEDADFKSFTKKYNKEF
ncbi:MAG: AAA family ATPase [Campylobacter sp.]|nr:AAA family ATPase [Campylobacter sp.]